MKLETKGNNGFFDKIVNTLNILQKHRVTFGISITATRDNAKEIISDEPIDFYFNKYGAAYAWVFHYMPNGRDIAPELIPTPRIFFPSAAGNLKVIYEKNGNLNDLFNHPLHKKIREWQFNYWQDGDLLRPCPIRDHYLMAKNFVIETKAMPADQTAEGILRDPNYEIKMKEYGFELARKTSIIWRKVYRNGTRKAI